MRVFRVQDWRGRGPFKPGLSERWLDRELAPGREYLPDFMSEFGLDVLVQLGQPGEFYGCAVRTLPELDRWFSPTERVRLEFLGYNIVSLRAHRIVAESPNQMLIARRKPFKAGAVILPWRALAQSPFA